MSLSRCASFFKGSHSGGDTISPSESYLTGRDLGFTTDSVSARPRFAMLDVFNYLILIRLFFLTADYSYKSRSVVAMFVIFSVTMRAIPVDLAVTVLLGKIITFALRTLYSQRNCLCCYFCGFHKNKPPFPTAHIDFY